MLMSHVPTSGTQSTIQVTIPRSHTHTLTSTVVHLVAHYSHCLPQHFRVTPGKHTVLSPMLCGASRVRQLRRLWPERASEFKIPQLAMSHSCTCAGQPLRPIPQPLSLILSTPHSPPFSSEAVEPMLGLGLGHRSSWGSRLGSAPLNLH